MEGAPLVPDPWTLGVPPRSACPRDFLDLSDAQSPHGCSPYAARRAVEAVGASRDDGPRALETLSAALSRKFSIADNRITLGAGCRVLLPAMLRALCRGGEKVAVASPPPPLHSLAAAQAAVALVEVPMTDDLSHALDPWLACLRERHPRVALVGHPLNPSGRFLAREDMLALLACAARYETFVVLDEAYADYADKPEFPRMAPLLDEAPHAVILRSFSSLQGLAGIPVAYALSTAELASRMAPFVRGQAPAAVAAHAATASVEEPSFDQLVCDRVGRARFRMLQALREWKIPCQGGFAPWVMLSAADAPDAARRLAARGLRVRDVSAWGLDGWLRVRAGSDDEVTRFLRDAKPVLAP